ncbi:MAG: hypothetical protein HY063_12885 [Bacteroidetes bacterium]|nr:hypothetical protein [Bacteroidota bacterium]
MEKKKINIRFSVLIAMVLAAAFSRLIPHPPNFASIGAIALFGAAYFSNRIIAFIIPLLSMWLSDIVINNTIYAHYWNHFWIIPDGFPFNYFAFLLTVPLGFLLLKKIKVVNVIGASVLAAILFFLISNFGVWLNNPIYPQNISGLISCYAVAIPFFGNTLAGDLFYSAILFGGFELAKYTFPILAKSKTAI